MTVVVLWECTTYMQRSIVWIKSSVVYLFLVMTGLQHLLCVRCVVKLGNILLTMSNAHCQLLPRLDERKKLHNGHTTLVVAHLPLVIKFKHNGLHDAHCKAQLW